MPNIDLRLDFQRVSSHLASTWPDPQVPAQVHLDFSVDDIEAAERRALTLGAGKPHTQPGGNRFTVLIDPSGHPFCLTTPQIALIPNRD